MSMVGLYHKWFLHRIVTGDKKWIYFDNPKRRKTICDSDELSTSTPKRNIHREKTMLCIWWNQKGVVYHELLKSGQTVTGDLYQEQIIHLSQALHRKRPEYKTRQHKVILLQRSASRYKTCQENVKNTSLGSATSCGLFTGLCPFRLSLVSTDDTRTCRGTLQFL